MTSEQLTKRTKDNLDKIANTMDGNGKHDDMPSGAASVAVIGAGLLVPCTVLQTMFQWDLFYTTAIGALAFAILAAWQKFSGSTAPAPEKIRNTAVILILTFVAYFNATRGTGAAISPLLERSPPVYEGPALSGINASMFGAPGKVADFNPSHRLDKRRSVWQVEVIPSVCSKCAHIDTAKEWRDSVQLKKKRVRTLY